MTKDVNFAKVIKIDIPPIEVLVTGYNEMEHFHICECVASGNRESVNVDLSMCYYFPENTSPEDLIGKWLVIYSMYPYSWIADEFEEMGDKPEDRNILLIKRTRRASGVRFPPRTEGSKGQVEASVQPDGAYER